jgi:signal transduction histidine kinase
MHTPTPQHLREIFASILGKVDDDALQFLIDKAVCHTVKQDDFLFKKGDASDYMTLILKGHLKVYTLQQNQQRELFELEKGEITGLLPYSRLTHAQGYAQAQDEVQVMQFHRRDMPELIRNHYGLTEALVHHMSSRIREFTTFQQQNEKMMALGKLSAGLAHELNNPASAIVRSSKELKRHLAQEPESFKKVISMRMTSEEVDAVNDILFKRLSMPAEGKKSLLQRQNMEDELTDCLLDLSVKDADEVAENLVEFGFECAEVEAIHARTGDEHFGPVMHWINNNLITEKMVNDIEEASSRIATLVSSVKTFTHMDRSPEKIKADLHEGLENTLIMLNHKVKQTNVKLVKDFSESMPAPKVFVSELNQVWTNLIDNALDALAGQEDAVLTIETRQDGAFARVKIIDNGPGMPEDVKESVFDPFFTTKAIGKGTGLGLDVAKKIIEKHNGTLKLLESSPGKTVFEVCIPFE